MHWFNGVLVHVVVSSMIVHTNAAISPQNGTDYVVPTLSTNSKRTSAKTTMVAVTTTDSTDITTEENDNGADSGQSDADELLQLLLGRCPYLNTYQKPVASQSDSITVRMLVTLDRFLDIDEESETFGIAGTFTVCWDYPPCAAWDNDSKFANVTWIYVPLKNSSSGAQRWIPTVRLQNAADDSRAISHMAQDMGYLYITSDGSGCIEPYGQIRMTCPPLAHNLVKFPFDVQTCNIEFARQANDPTITFYNSGFDTSEEYDEYFSNSNELGKNNKTFRLTVMVPEDFIEESSVWELLDIGFDGSDTKMSYQFAFKRRPKASIYAILLPSVLLMLLQLFVYAIPPHHPERPLYSITVVLSFYILQTVLTASIPQSSITLIIVDYLACQLCVGVFVTLYTCIVTHFGNVYKHDPVMLFKRKKGKNHHNSATEPPTPRLGGEREVEHHSNDEGGIDVIRFADCIAAFITILIMVIYNGYFFGKMMATDPDPVLSWGNSN